MAEIYIVVVYTKIESWSESVESRDPQPSIIVNRFGRRTVMVSSCYRHPMGYTYHSLTTFLRRYAVPFFANICEGTSLTSLVSRIAYVTPYYVL